eukprot:CAMPEP_0175021056 /NCGR_PEP_ID=MMETSP0005-20121125/14495_1 /TAXON_ID=420556 /ORGANISM="Ochromonas sp., Strain CCMP1393" /LENGTH=166 /DNA_ID=CAMNT_0016279047 /DNA_START=291 /DNA_END=787 /DNA_ORIENTATION=-
MVARTSQFPVPSQPAGSTETRKTIWAHKAVEILLLATPGCPAQGPMGLAPDLVPAAILATIFDAATITVHTPAVPPGPAQPIDTAENARQHQQRMAQSLRYEKYQEAAGTLYREYVAAVKQDKVIYRAMCAPNGHLAHTSLLTLHTAMNAKYGILIADDLRAIDDS